MRCEEVQPLLDAMRTGELMERERVAVEKHLASCGECSELRVSMGALAGQLTSLRLTPPRDFYDRVDDAFVAFTRNGLRMIRSGLSLDEFRAAYAKRYRRALEAAPLPAALRRQVVAAIAGEANGAKVDLAANNELEAEVIATLTRIPRGEVRTYAWVARQVGRPRAVRAVGNVIARNVVPFVVPCHRVVPSTGGVGNYIFGEATKRVLLEREGVDVAQLERLAREHVRYVGSKTTHIFCFPTCRDARRIREENRVPFRDEEHARSQGFRPCRHCEPAAA